MKYEMTCSSTIFIQVEIRAWRFYCRV